MEGWPPADGKAKAANTQPDATKPTTPGAECCVRRMQILHGSVMEAAGELYGRSNKDGWRIVDDFKVDLGEFQLQRSMARARQANSFMKIYHSHKDWNDG